MVDYAHSWKIGLVAKDREGAMATPIDLDIKAFLGEILKDGVMGDLDEELRNLSTFYLFLIGKRDVPFRWYRRQRTEIHEEDG